jgi:two-component system phosphate regulon response regulator PhoB
MKKTTILVVEDEAPIREMIKFSLNAPELVILEAEDTVHAERILAEKIPDLILLDWMLPGMSGVAWIRKIKRHEVQRHIPIVLLTARAEEENKVKGLESGADDYVTKPFSPRELLARIKSVLRRGARATAENILKAADLQLDVNAHQVSAKNNPIRLKPIEYRLLHFFMLHPEHVYSRQQLLDQVWGTDAEIDERTVDVQIRRLRKALAQYNCDKLIATVHGIGYKFSVPV